MSEYDDDFDNEGDEQDRSPAGLRKAYEAQKKALKAAEDARKKAEQELSKYKVGDVLKERGIEDARAKTLLAKSGVDLAKPEDIDGWLGEYGDLFGYKRSEQVSPETQEQATAIQQMNLSEQGGIPDNQRENVLAQIRSASPDELPAILAKLSPNIKSGI